MDTILLDQQLRESLRFADPTFPINYYVDDLNRWADHQVPLHWHLGYEFFSTIHQDVEVQVGHEHLLLRKGESILIGGGQLHSYRMTESDKDCLCPNIVFSDEVLAPITSLVFTKYFSPILNDPALPYIIFTSEKEWQTRVLEYLFSIYGLLAAHEEAWGSSPACGAVKAMKSDCPEIEIHQNLISIFQALYCHRQELHYTKSGGRDQQTQIHLQKMLGYIQEHFAENISLEQLSRSAGISRSEAGRCFKKYYAQPPMAYVTLYRLKYAQELLANSSLSVNEIASQCGFGDSSYFIKVFRKHFNQTPSEYRNTDFQLLKYEYCAFQAEEL